MSKELTPLEALKEMGDFKINLRYVVKLEGEGGNNEYEYERIKDMFPFEFPIIENALKEKEQQDNLIKIIKETIEFGIIDHKVEELENGDYSINGKVGIFLKKEIENKEKLLLRQWALETCFPKELKAFEIIKEKRVDITTLIDCCNAKEYNRWVPIRSHYFFRPFELTQEEYELLKEVLS